ncbi:alpha/beta fold hydrolase [Streptomyces blastmyceticus]|uniref:Condensation domain-containing protein n=1 Tax=Streptomyces blastmyceticus TaxID=68180 RepID=A0ABP3GKX1_9ACTN
MSWIVRLMAAWAPGPAHPRPVVLVNGTLENVYATWSRLAPQLRSDGYCVFGFNYGGVEGSPFQQLGPMRDSGRQLAAFVDRVRAATGAPKVDLVGHSQDGLLPLYYINRLHGRSKVARMVGIEPASQGVHVYGLLPLAGRTPGLARHNSRARRTSSTSWPRTRAHSTSPTTSTPSTTTSPCAWSATPSTRTVPCRPYATPYCPSCCDSDRKAVRPVLQIPVAELDVFPGCAVEWRVRAMEPRGAAEAARPRGIASYNQEEGFTTAQDAHGADDPVFVHEVVTFEIQGRLDRPALDSALLYFVRRHEVLRCTFQQLAGDLSCDVLEPDDVALETIDSGYFDSSVELRSHLARFIRKIDALSGLLFVMGAVIGDERTTVYLAFDHLVTDGVSASIAVHDVATAYAAFSCGRQPVLPEAGSYLTFSHEQRRRIGSMDVDDDRLDHWKAFMARNGDFFPPFPLDLGLEPGRMYPAVNETDTLLAEVEVEALEARCRAANGRLFMGLLAAVGISLRKEGGPEVYRGFMPVSGRGQGPYTHSMGWFANPMPIEFSVAKGKDLTEVMTDVRTASSEMRKHVDVPFVKALHLLAPQYSAMSSWPYAVNLFSYLDFRKTPGSGNHAAWKARKHVWVSHSNGICFFFHRNDTGLCVNSVFADTPQARHTKEAFRETLSRTLENMARSGTF